MIFIYRVNKKASLILCENDVIFIYSLILHCHTNVCSRWSRCCHVVIDAGLNYAVFDIAKNWTKTLFVSRLVWLHASAPCCSPRSFGGRWQAAESRMSCWSFRWCKWINISVPVINKFNNVHRMATTLLVAFCTSKLGELASGHIHSLSLWILFYIFN